MTGFLIHSSKFSEILSLLHICLSNASDSMQVARPVINSVHSTLSTAVHEDGGGLERLRSFTSILRQETSSYNNNNDSENDKNLMMMIMRIT